MGLDEVGVLLRLVVLEQASARASSGPTALATPARELYVDVSPAKHGWKECRGLIVAGSTLLLILGVCVLVRGSVHVWLRATVTHS